MRTVRPQAHDVLKRPLVVHFTTPAVIMVVLQPQTTELTGRVIGHQTPAFGIIDSINQADLFHDPDGEGVNALGLQAGAVGFELVTSVLAELSLRHLTSGRIARTQKQYLNLFFSIEIHLNNKLYFNVILCYIN